MHPLAATMLLLESVTYGAERSSAEYRFTAQDNLIAMKVVFFDPYRGTRLSLYSGGQELCFPVAPGESGCYERFVGAMALVEFSVRQKDGTRPTGGKIRERVVLIDKSPEVPDRQVFQKVAAVLNGVASDIQLYGYDEARVPEHRRAESRAEVRPYWMRLRQELYWNDEDQPFAAIEWRHSIDEVRLLCVGTGRSLMRGAVVPSCQ